MHCITIAVRGAESLHLCYSSRSEAWEALEQFDGEISHASDGELITLSQEERRVALLKRDFRSLELRHFDDDDEPSPGNDDEINRSNRESVGEGDGTDPRLGSVPPNPRSSRSWPRSFHSDLSPEERVKRRACDDIRWRTSGNDVVRLRALACGYA